MKTLRSASFLEMRWPFGVYCDYPRDHGRWKQCSDHSSLAIL